MLGHIIKALFSTAPNSKYDIVRQSVPAVSRPYGHLDAVERGLTRSANLYLETGQGRLILPLLASKVGEHTSFRPSINYPEAVSATNMLAYNLGGQPKTLARYGELQQAISPFGSRWFEKGLGHHAAISAVVRNLLSMYSRQPESPAETPTTWDDLRAAVKILGGNDVDIVHYALTARGFTEYCVNLAPQVQGNFPEQFDSATIVAALERLQGKNRIIALRRLGQKPAVKAPDFLPFLMKQGAESMGTLRNEAARLLQLHNHAAVTALALEMLKAKKVTERLFAVEALGAIGSPAALKALANLQETEKSHSVRMALELFLLEPKIKRPQVENGYIDVNGKPILLPREQSLIDDGSSPLDESFVAKFDAVEAKMQGEADARYEKSIRHWEKNNRAYAKPQKKPVAHLGAAWLAVLNTPVATEPAGKQIKPRRPSYGLEHMVDPIIEAALDEIPMRRAIDLALLFGRDLPTVLCFQNEPIFAYVQDTLANGRIEFADIVKIAKENGTAYQRGPSKEECKPESFERGYIKHYVVKSSWFNMERNFTPGIWQIAVGHLHELAEFLPPRKKDLAQALRALRVIADFPSLPADLVQPLLFVAISERTRLRIPAQKLLADVPDLTDQLIAILADKRQAMRANAARFLADRDAKAALPALTKRLRTEKTDLARAEMISAVARLGGDTAPYLDREVLMKEARTLVDKLPDDKLSWLDQSTAPRLQWVDGSDVDPVILDAWLRLAVKRNAPLSSALFGLYFDQMTPDSVTNVSDWILRCWITYDTEPPTIAPIDRERAEKIAKYQLGSVSDWLANRSYSLEELIEMNMRKVPVPRYPNSGADSKGILALTHRATPATSAPMIARYLKHHSKRMSQVKALVETLYGMGSKEAVQVLVVKATRTKQKTICKLAENLLAQLAEAKDWTEDELADRSISTGGFDKDGILLLEVGEEAKPYVARLARGLSIELFNPQGKLVKSIPDGKDPNTKEAKSQLSAAKKSVRIALNQQRARLYEAMVNGRFWDCQSWQDDLMHHPVMKRLIEDVIWRGLDDNGELISGLRLTSEGKALNAAGDELDLTTFPKIDLAHTSNLPKEDRQAWLKHLKDFEVKPLFAQVSRPVRVLTNEEMANTRLTDREGWMTTTFKLRTAAKKADYVRGPILDHGEFLCYRKEFRDAQICADLYFTGSGVQECDSPTAIKYMQFTQMNNGGWSRALQLSKVPPLLLSEVWNDLHEISKSGAFDADWESKYQH